MGTVPVTRLVIFGLSISVLGCARPDPPSGGRTAVDRRQGLHDPDVTVRREAVTTAGAIKNPQAVPDLVTALKDKDGEVRAKAAGVLWGLGAEAKDAAPALVPLLRDRHAGVRLNAAGALGQVGADAKAAIPALKDALKD